MQNNISITANHVRDIYHLVKERIDSPENTLFSLQKLLLDITGIDPCAPESIEERIERSRQISFAKHGSQTYGRGESIVSYTRHLEDVVDILRRFNHTDPNLIIAGYLHDSIEDTDMSYNDIRSMFGEVVADIVYCVTDELGKNRKERKARTYAKIAGNRSALVIKLADRIANIEYGIHTKSDLVQMYRKEQNDFKKSLFVPGFVEDMWKHLDLILSI